jgi:hypothetical protein
MLSLRFHVTGYAAFSADAHHAGEHNESESDKKFHPSTRGDRAIGVGLRGKFPTANSAFG